MEIKEKNTEGIPRRKTWAHDFITCRRVLNIMVFLGFMVNYMLRVNLTFAIVDMVMKLPNITDITSVKSIAIDIPKLNRSTRSISGPAYMEAFPDIDAPPGNDDDEQSNTSRDFRKKNVIGNKAATVKKPVIPNFNASTGGKTSFQSFSSGTPGKFQSTGGQVFTGAGGKTQFTSGGGGGSNFQSFSSNMPGSSFQSSGSGAQGGTFRSAGSSNFQSFNGSSGSGSSFQSSSGGSQSGGFQQKTASGLQSAAGTGESEVIQKKSVSGLNSGLPAASSAVQSNQFQQSSQIASDDAAQSNGAGSVNSANNDDGTSGNGSDNLQPNGKVGLAANAFANSSADTNVDQDDSLKTDDTILGEEKTDDQRILFTRDADKQSPQVGNSKLADENVSDKVEGSTVPPGLAVVNSSAGLDMFGNFVEMGDRIRRFNWSESQQGILIGSFFWGYICTELPGGRLAEVIGARRVFGYATLGASVVTLLTPLSAKIHFIFVVIIRILLGLFLGPTWPSILPLASKWIPPDERGKFLSNMMGSTLGAGFTLPLCGLIIAQFSWEYVFYITGLLGFVWSVMWFILIFETPADHPRISPEERWYIETKLGLRPSKDSATYSNEEKQVSQGLIVANQAADDSCLSDNEQKNNDDGNRNYSTFTHTNGNLNNGNSDTKNETSYDKKSSLESATDSETESSANKIPNSTETNLVLAPNGKAAQSEAQNQSSHANAPWLHILTSVPVWAFVLTHGASVFGYNTITNQLPTYMKYILHYNIKQNGVLSSLPYIGKYVAALIGGSIADRLLRSSRFSKKFVRKLFTAIGVMIPGFLMILQIFVGDHKVVSIFVFTAALTANGCVTGGYLGNSLDIAPNYSGTVFGLGNMFSGLSGAVSAIIVGFLTDGNQVYGQWQKVFLIVAITYFVGSLLFLIFGSTDVQWWNNSSPKAHKKKNETHNNINEETLILQADRRRTSVSSVMRSYTEDELGNQSNYSSGKDYAQKSRKKRRRKKITSEESESNYSSKHKINSKSEYTQASKPPSLKPLFKNNPPDSDTISSDNTDERKSKEDTDTDQTKIKLRKKRPEKYHEDYSLNFKKRISYKEAIENGSRSDYSYDSENKPRFTPNKTNVKKIKNESDPDESENTRSKKISRINERDDEHYQRNSSDTESDNQHKKVFKKHKIHNQEKSSDDDSTSESTSNYKSKREHRSKQLRSQSSKEVNENNETNETKSRTSKKNGSKKPQKKLRFHPEFQFTDTPADNSNKTRSGDKRIKKSTKNTTPHVKSLKTNTEPSTSAVSNQNDDDSVAQNKDKSENRFKRKLDLTLQNFSNTLKQSPSSPL